ncbi:MAG: hypothetical protein V4612_07255 [Pseudomonadota bacterium]
MKNQKIFRNKNQTNKKIFNRPNSVWMLFGMLIMVICLALNNDAKADWFGKKEESCKNLVDKGIGSKAFLKVNYKKIYDICAEKSKTGDYLEIYSRYTFYKYIDKSFQDKMEANKYHWMLFYANQNSREFDSKTKEFKKEQGLYEQELKDFEEQITQEEKIKSFSYIADNLATGNEGWVLKHDYQKSFEYLKRAAEVGDLFSQAELGACYFGGGDRFYKMEFPVNYVEAYKWTYLSILHSKQKNTAFESSKKMLDIISSKASKIEIMQAKKDANNWLKQNEKFIKSHPLEIVNITKEQAEIDKKQTQEIINKYEMYLTPIKTNK